MKRWGEVIMRITVVGAGYVGLVTAVCFADSGHNVTCLDKDEVKIGMLCQGEVPIYEPNLKELICQNLSNNKLNFTIDTFKAISTADVIVIAVGTPPLDSGEANLDYVYQVAKEIGQLITEYKLVVVKSTVPVGTNDEVENIIQERYSGRFDVVSIPEFLREGTALQDTLYPERVIIGVNNNRSRALLDQLFNFVKAPIVITDRRNAEMIKYASNAFLATKISFINEIANICEKVGADVEEVAHGMGLDSRIGTSFLKAGIGYGGSCFPKDTKALIQIAGNVEYDFKLLKSVVEVNSLQRRSVVKKLMQSLGELKGKTIAVWGLSFKPGTDDVRESPAVEIVQELLVQGARLQVFDPVAMDSFRELYDHDNITWSKDKIGAVQNSDALCLLTDWDEFKNVDLKMVSKKMRIPLLIDGRNVFNKNVIKDSGLIYHSIGRNF